jgi:hypothetical protein
MNDNKERQLKEAFPNFFREALPFGIECSDGWFDLIYKLCEDIQTVNPPEDFLIACIKEKYGRLCIHFYATKKQKEIYDLIDKAEEESTNICEECGSRENITTEGGYILTLCTVCRSKLDKRIRETRKQ